MKLLIVLILTAIFGMACQKASLPTETISQPTPETPTPKAVPDLSLANLTEEQKQKLDESLPPKMREMFEQAEEPELLVNRDKETKKLLLVELIGEPNTIVKITEPALKKKILDALYLDTATDTIRGFACWNPRHRLKFKSKNKTVTVTICFECNSFRVTGSMGETYGNISEGKNLMPLLDDAIEKLGTDMP